MRFTTILFFFTLIYVNIFSQQPLRIDNGLKLFSLGKAIAKFDTLLKCAEDRTPTAHYTPDTSQFCKAYHYLPAQKDTILISNIRFAGVILFFSNKRKVTQVSFMKMYLFGDSINLMTQVLDDFANLLQFLNSRFHCNGKLNKLNSRDDQYSSHSEYTWYVSNKIYELAITQFKKRTEEQTLAYMMDLSFRKNE